LLRIDVFLNVKFIEYKMNAIIIIAKL